MSDALSPVLLSTFGLQREPPRAKSAREPEYEQKYDSDTLFFDVFLSDDGRNIVAPCPPLLNCESALEAVIAEVEDECSRHQAKPCFDRPRRVVRFPLETDCVPITLRLTLAGKTQSLKVQPSKCERFLDRRVLFTLSQNNPLHWVRDWVTFYVRVHGVDAVVFYDNQSTHYSIADLQNVLASIDGLQTFVVQSWNFPYGPGEGPNGEWDSNYCQNAAISHMRWKYCAQAQAVINADIDEMVVCDDGRSVFVHLEESGLPCLTYAGRWVTTLTSRFGSSSAITSGRDASALQHSDCLYFRKAKPYLNKWIADPRACGEDIQWGTHEIVGFDDPAVGAHEQDKPMTDNIIFRHCRQISTNFKYNREEIPPFISGRYLYDSDFARALAHAFPERKIFRTGGSFARRLGERIRQYWS